MFNDGSITVLLHSLKGGFAEDAAQQIFQRYISKLESTARAKIAGLRLHDRDDQDVAQLVMEQFFFAVRNGRFPRLQDRHDLWQILLVILERRVIDLRRRPPEPLCGESCLAPPAENYSRCERMGALPSFEPTPDMIVQLEEELRHRLQQLPEGLRQTAVWKLEGHSNAEIATLLKRSVKRVEAKLKLIRELWTNT
jgi:DNA-directed RNA polymerase specialized sigma24 family protein